MKKPYKHSLLLCIWILSLQQFADRVLTLDSKNEPKIDSKKFFKNSKEANTEAIHFLNHFRVE